MKKSVSILLVIVMIFALSACGGSPAKTEAVTYGFLEEDLGVESYAIGFRIGDDELAKTVSGAVQALVLNGT